MCVCVCVHLYGCVWVCVGVQAMVLTWRSKDNIMGGSLCLPSRFQR